MLAKSWQIGLLLWKWSKLKMPRHWAKFLSSEGIWIMLWPGGLWGWGSVDYFLFQQKAADADLSSSGSLEWWNSETAGTTAGLKTKTAVVEISVLTVLYRQQSAAVPSLHTRDEFVSKCSGVSVSCLDIESLALYEHWHLQCQYFTDHGIILLMLKSQIPVEFSFKFTLWCISNSTKWNS